MPKWRMDPSNPLGENLKGKKKLFRVTKKAKLYSKILALVV